MFEVVLQKEHEFDYIPDIMFQRMWRDFYVEVTQGRSSIETVLSDALFYMTPDIADWIIDSYLTAIISRDICGTVYKGIQMSDDYTEFFDMEWHVAGLYAEEQLKKDEWLYTKIMHEFWKHLRVERYAHLQYERSINDFPGCNHGTGLFPQYETW